MRVVVWKIGKTISRSGGKVVVIQSEEESRAEGEQYIERLREDGENVLEVREENNKFVITLE